MLFIKTLLLAVVIGVVLYWGVVLFPKKLRLLRRVRMDKTNEDLIALANSGAQEAAELLRKSRQSLWVALPVAVILTLLETMAKK